MAATVKPYFKALKMYWLDSITEKALRQSSPGQDKTKSTSEPEPQSELALVPEPSPLFAHAELVIFNLLRHLSPADLLRCRQVNRHWKLVTDDLLRLRVSGHPRMGLEPPPFPLPCRPCTLFTAPEDIEVFLEDFAGFAEASNPFPTGVVAFQFDQVQVRTGPTPRGGARSLIIRERNKNSTLSNWMKYVNSPLSRFRAKFGSNISMVIITLPNEVAAGNLSILELPFRLARLKVLRLCHLDRVMTEIGSYAEHWGLRRTHKGLLRLLASHENFEWIPKGSIKNLELQLLGDFPNEVLEYLHWLGKSAIITTLRIAEAQDSGWKVFETLGAPLILSPYLIPSLPEAFPNLRRVEVELNSSAKFTTLYLDRLEPYPSLVEFGVVLNLEWDTLGQPIRFGRRSVEGLFCCLDALFKRSFTNVRRLSLKVRGDKRLPSAEVGFIDWDDVEEFFLAPWDPNTETQYGSVKELEVSMWLVPEGQSYSFMWLGRKCPKLEVLEVVDGDRMEEWYRGQPKEKEQCELFWSWVVAQMPESLRKFTR